MGSTTAWHGVISNWLLLLAVLSLIFVPLAPQLLRLRIRFTRWIHWNWAADLLENHFQGWVLYQRAQVKAGTMTHSKIHNLRLAG